jgi:hypothetical protein
MLKKTLIASAIAAVSFGSVASTVTASGSNVQFATEIFGSNAAELNLETTKAVLVFKSEVGTGAKGKLTFTINGGTFGSDVLVSQFSSDNQNVTIDSISSGGRAGDSSVEVDVTTTGLVAVDNTVTLNVSTLRAPALAASGSDVKLVVGSKSVNNPSEGGAFVTATSTNAAAVAKSLDYLALTHVKDETDGNGLIDSDDNTKLTAGTFVAAKTTINESGVTLKKADGSDVVSSDFVTTKVTAVGPFNEGDKVSFDSRDLTVNGNIATDSVPYAAGADKATVYTPKGEEMLAPSSYSTTVAIQPKTTTWRTVSKIVVSATNFNGQDKLAAVNAVPNSASSDVMNLNVSNTSGKTLNLFVQTVDAEGNRSGTIQLDPLEAGQTARYTSADLEEIVGAWEGRVRVEFTGSDEFEVTALMRSNGTLTNNSGSVVSTDNN